MKVKEKRSNQKRQVRKALQRTCRPANKGNRSLPLVLAALRLSKLEIAKSGYEDQNRGNVDNPEAEAKVEQRATHMERGTRYQNELRDSIIKNDSTKTRGRREVEMVRVQNDGGRSQATKEV